MTVRRAVFLCVLLSAGTSPDGCACESSVADDVVRGSAMLLLLLPIVRRR